MTLIKRPAPELLTFKNWYQSVAAAPDGSGLPSGTYSDLQPSNLSTKVSGGEVGVKTFDLTVTVLKSKSWVVDAKASTALLEHERLHYLIAICVARDAHEDVYGATAASSSGLSQAIMQLLREAGQRAQAISDQYDRETANGARPSDQSLWNARVGRWYSIGFKEW
jgi:hypothetical protein